MEVLVHPMREKENEDALQLAIAVHHSADYFLTNDKRLISFKELEIIILDDII